MKHLITLYPPNKPYHDDMLGETVFIVGLPFWEIYDDNSRSHQFFGDFRIFNGTPLGEMDIALTELAQALRAIQRVIIEAELKRSGHADMEWIEARYRK